MKRYFGTVQGSRTKTTNSGTDTSGLRTEAMSPSGMVVVQLMEVGGVDTARVYLKPNPKTNMGTDRLLYEGPVNGPIDGMDLIPYGRAVTVEPVMVLPLRRDIGAVHNFAPSGVRVLSADEAARMMTDNYDRHHGRLTPAGDESDDTVAC